MNARSILFATCACLVAGTAASETIDERWHRLLLVQYALPGCRPDVPEVMVRRIFEASYEIEQQDEVGKERRISHEIRIETEGRFRVCGYMAPIIEQTLAEFR